MKSRYYSHFSTKTTVCTTALPFTEIVFFKKAVPSSLSPSHWPSYTSTEGNLAPSEPAFIVS